MNLENLLKMFAASNADELKIEPGSKPYLITNNNKTNVSEITMTAAIISQIIFPIIPLEDKLRLPSLPQIVFRYTDDLGVFGVTVAKSPIGLIVTIKKISVPSLDLKNNFQAEIAIPTALDGTELIESPNKVASTPNPFVIQKQNSSGEIPRQTVLSTATQTVAPPSTSNIPAVNLHSALPNAVDDEDFNPELFVLESDLPPAVLQTISFDSKTDEEGKNFKDQDEVWSAPETIEEQPALEKITRSEHLETPNSNNLSISATPQMDALFYKMAERKASDLHLSVSMPPMIRKDGEIAILDENQEALTPDVLRDLLLSIMPEKNREEFERRHDTDFAYEIKGLARFRANIFMDRKGMGGVFRIIPTKILTAEQLGLSEAITNLCNLSKGLVVVTGPTGSGKSTTLAAMIDYVNRKRSDHIITIEDPIEFVHENQKCLLNQREVHNHTDSFKDALRAALREDPDILLVGEMRDLETISIAIETAETGHLVFGTLHTTTAPSTVDRIIDQFPADRQQQIRVMLSESLKGVIAQTLLPKKGGGRVAALEVLIITPAISNLIREGKTFQIASAMQTGKQHGMVVLNDALLELVKKGDVEPHHAYLKAVDKTGLEALYKRHGIDL